MKKILLASNILAASTGFAAAEVTVGGSATMGVTYTHNAPNEFAFVSNIEIEFTASGETDGGLSFGGTVLADEAVDGSAGTAGSVFISGAFGKLSMGDVDGAAEFVVGDLDGVGYDGLGDLNENAYFANGELATGLNELALEADPDAEDLLGLRPTARYEYTTGSLTFALSIDNPGNNVAGVFEDVYALGAKYEVDGYSLALGVESVKAGGETLTHVIAGASATFAGVNVKAVYGRASDVGFTQYGLSATYEMDAVGVTGYYRVEDFDAIGTDPASKGTVIGLGASYDLGGGASILGGVARAKLTEAGVSETQTLADLGLSFEF
jgi:outer membrane protein OmpU